MSEKPKKHCDKCIHVRMCKLIDQAGALTYQRGISHQHDGVAADEFRHDLWVLIAGHCDFFKE